MSKEKKKKPETRKCDICEKELSDDEETYCNKCIGGSEDLVPSADESLDGGENPQVDDVLGDILDEEVEE